MLSGSLTRTYSKTVTVPPGTTIAAPLIIPWITEDEFLVSIDLIIPAGHNGLTGIRFMKSDVQFLPWGVNSWITANDFSKGFVVGGAVSTRDLKIQAYNLGTYQHSFYLLASITNLSGGTLQPTSIESGALSFIQPTASSDPLSPDSIMGPDTVELLFNGDISSSDVASVDIAPLLPQVGT